MTLQQQADAIIFRAMKSVDYFAFALDNARREFPQMIAQQAERLRNGAPPNMPRDLVKICAWCKDEHEQTAAARAQGFDVSHTMCPACSARMNAGMDNGGEQ
jgi:hypothetical protein